MSDATPGPWIANEFGLVYGPPLPEDGNGESVLVADCIVDNERERPTPTEAANAQLIAAAPNLLATVRLLVSALCDAIGGLEAAEVNLTFDDVFDQAESVIATATGERP